jgi:hypothetical protein
MHRWTVVRLLLCVLSRHVVSSLPVLLSLSSTTRRRIQPACTGTERGERDGSQRLTEQHHRYTDEDPTRLKRLVCSSTRHCHAGQQRGAAASEIQILTRGLASNEDYGRSRKAEAYFSVSVPVSQDISSQAPVNFCRDCIRRARGGQRCGRHGDVQSACSSRRRHSWRRRCRGCFIVSCSACECVLCPHVGSDHASGWCCAIAARGGREWPPAVAELELQQPRAEHGCTVRKLTGSCSLHSACNLSVRHERVASADSSQSCTSRCCHHVASFSPASRRGCRHE